MKLHKVSGASRTSVEGVSDVLDLDCAADGTTWFVDHAGVGRVRGGRVEHLPRIPGAPAYGTSHMVASPDGRLFATVGGSAAGVGGLWTFEHNKWSRHLAEGPLGGTGSVLYSDSKRRLWMGYRDGLIGLPFEGAGRLFSSGSPGLGVVRAVLETSDGILAAGSNGLAIFRETKFQMLEFVDRASARAVGGMVQSLNGDLWLNAARGIIHVRSSELRVALSDPKHPIKIRARGRK